MKPAVIMKPAAIGKPEAIHGAGSDRQDLIATFMARLNCDIK